MVKTKEERIRKIGKKIGKGVDVIYKGTSKKITSKGKRTILRKPTAKVKSVSPQGFISGGLVKQNKDNGNKTGYIKEEMMEDRISWLS